jgi:plastocyanin
LTYNSQPLQYYYFGKQNRHHPNDENCFSEWRDEMKKTIIGLSIFTVLAVVLTACSSAAPAASPAVADSKPASAAPVSGSVNIEMSGFAFNPKELTVKVGTTVTWTNKDSAGHDVKAADGSWGSATLTNGQSFSKVFDKEGTYAYVCTFHPGMAGTIIVTK